MQCIEQDFELRSRLHFVFLKYCNLEKKKYNKISKSSQYTNQYVKYALMPSIVSTAINMYEII